MNVQTAQILLKALLQRLKADAAGEKPQYEPVVSGTEREALDLLLQYHDSSSSEPSVSPQMATLPSVILPPTKNIIDPPQIAPELPEGISTEVPYELNLAGLNEKDQSSHIVCIDFGTAKSKAFGRRTSSSDLSLPSERVAHRRTGFGLSSGCG
jgi:hypothetical protein